MLYSNIYIVIMERNEYFAFAQLRNANTNNINPFYLRLVAGLTLAQTLQRTREAIL